MFQASGAVIPVQPGENLSLAVRPGTYLIQNILVQGHPIDTTNKYWAVLRVTAVAVDHSVMLQEIVVRTGDGTNRVFYRFGRDHKINTTTIHWEAWVEK